MGASLLISELSDRTGFSTSTLRYYEQVGLLTADGRSPAGYRLYDERAAGRLRFIARAKQLGLPLDEIRGLVAVWDEGTCAHVRERLRARVSARADEVQRRIDELAAFAVQLASAKVELSGPWPGGPCGDDCGCSTERAGATPRLIELRPTTRTDVQDGHAHSEASHGCAPVACTLDAADLPERMAEWRDVLKLVTDRVAIEGGLALHFPFDPVLAARLADLAVREQTCCAFFGFTMRIDRASLLLDIRGPEAASEAITALFGSVATR